MNIALITNSRKLLKSILLAMAVLIQIQSYSQSYNIDSLMLEFKNAPGVDLRTYDQLFIALYPEYMPELVVVAEDLLKRSVHEKNLNGMHRAADAFGLYFTSKGLFNQAFKELYRSMRFYERTGNQGYLMKSYHYLGTLFLNWGNVDEAIYYYKKIVQLAVKNPEQNAAHTGRNNLALAYFQKNRYDLGIIILKENQRYIKFMNAEGRATMENLFGNYYLHLNKIDSAKLRYEKSSEYSKLASENRLVSTALANLAICKFYENPESAKQLFDSSYVYALKSKSSERISVSLFNLASWYLEMNDKSSALDMFNESYIVAKKSNSYQNMFDALDEISEIYRSQNKWTNVDSINILIRELKSKQYQELFNLGSDIAIIEKAFNQQVYRDHISRFKDLPISKASIVIISSLIILLIIQPLIFFIILKKTKQKNL